MLAFDMPFHIPNNDNDDRQDRVYDEHQRTPHMRNAFGRPIDRPTEVCEPSSTVSRVYISRLWRSIDEGFEFKNKKKTKKQA